VVSQCQTDDDCGAGSLCASYEGPLCDNGFACFRPDDFCATATDCRLKGFPGSCIYEKTEERRVCGVCGRPFLVEAAVRVAPVVAANEWNAPSGDLPRIDHLTSDERRMLAEHWTRMGQMEHASIAAFARFSLQLLALGAPPELVEACNRALVDETAHTRLCFRLAGAYAGRAIGPGPLDVSGDLLPTSLLDIVDLVIAEGCFGETGAALEALQAADAASDPVIAAAYARIAVDEQRHAELAFRFLGWALEQSPNDVASCIASAIASPPAHDDAARAVALPCLQALLSAHRPAFADSTLAPSA
jgi:hypothetical protein